MTSTTHEQLVARTAEVLDLDLDTAALALADRDPVMVDLARQVIDLHGTRAQWHADMDRHCRNLRRLGC